MKTFKFVLLALMSIPFATHAAKSTGPLKVDVSGSKLKWVGTKLAGSHNGAVAIKEGSVSFDGDVPKEGSFVVDLATITNNDLTDAGYNKKLVDHLKSDDFFAVAKFPTAVFKLTKADKRGTEVVLTGDLTIKGITKPISFPVVISKAGNVYSAKAKFKINRLDWDIKYNSGKFFDPKKLGDKMINDDIEFELDLKTLGA